MVDGPVGRAWNASADSNVSESELRFRSFECQALSPGPRVDTISAKHYISRVYDLLASPIDLFAP